MDKIAPLLNIKPSEAVINFMTGHIRRFIQSPQGTTQASFDSLFGEGVDCQEFKGISSNDLDDVLAEKYSESLAKFGDFPYVRTAIVLHPNIDRTHFHLIYATRNAAGVDVFKEAEKAAMRIMESVRANARQRKRQRRTGQGELFGSETLYDSTYYESLRDRYARRSEERVLELLRSKGRVKYDDAWDAALQEPLVWESDLKEWIEHWKKGGKLRIEGLKARQKIPRRGNGHYLIWQEMAK